MKAIAFNPSTVERTWVAFQESVGGLAPIATRRDRERAVALMNRLVDIVGGDERHPLASLLHVVGDLVEDYESREGAFPDAAPHEVLRHLIEVNGLTQADLGRELGGQSVVSAILGGKRAINARQARALADRFGISPAAFV